MNAEVEMPARVRQIVLSGPPGAGKTTVARSVAQKLQGPALDLDALIEAAEHQTSAEIIRTRGEPAFREIEAQVLRAADTSAPVIALGGGTLITPSGRAAARSRGPVLGLFADVETLRSRVSSSDVDRPLLEGSGLEALLEARRTSYAAVDGRIPAEADPDTVADRVIARAADLHVIVAAMDGHRTRVVVGSDLAQAASGAVLALAPSRPVLAIEDSGVPEEARDRIVAGVSAVFPVHRVRVQGGETVKQWSVLGSILEIAVAAGCGRQSVVLGIGGGATCDLAALAASLLGRGAPLVLVPSTLLAQADASIGGKCAVNMAGGRNLVGAFHPANDVIADLDLLESLDPSELRSGLAEVLKIGIISAPEVFERVANGEPMSPALLATAVMNKAAIVARDPTERGERRLLNLGHTLAHAIEAASGFEVRHGDAVAIGIAAMARFSTERGWLAPETRDRIIRALERVGLPTALVDQEILRKCESHLAQDKKGDVQGLDVVCIHGLGKVSSIRLSFSEAKGLVRCGGCP